MPRRKRAHLVHDVRQVLRLRRKRYPSALRIAVKEGTDANRVARGDEAPSLRVVYHHGKLRVEFSEHIKSVLLVKRKYQLAVAVAREGILLFELLFDGTEAVKLPVADGAVSVHKERLHSLFGEPHYGKALKADYAAPEAHRPLHIRSARRGLCKGSVKSFVGHILSRIYHYRTHKFSLLRNDRNARRTASVAPKRCFCVRF